MWSKTFNCFGLWSSQNHDAWKSERASEIRKTRLNYFDHDVCSAESKKDLKIYRNTQIKMFT